MLKPERFLLCVVLIGLLAACGTPATPPPTFVPTQALPTRLPVIDNARGTQSGVPAAVAAQPTGVPLTPTTPSTAVPTAVPATKIPPSPTRLLATATKVQATATTAAPAASGDPAKGQLIFNNGAGPAPACNTCHNIDSADVKVGPSLQGIAMHGAMHAQTLGQDLTTYLHTSIVNPNAYLVENENGHVFSAGGVSLMFQDYAKNLTEQQINDVVAYLLTLK